MSRQERSLKRYLEMKNLEGWKEYRALQVKKIKKVDSPPNSEGAQYRVSKKQK